MILLLLAGLVLLVAGAEGLVRGASRLAAAAGVSPLVIGLTVVALGTSAPELAITVRASLSGAPDIALGNVVGSNIFNVLGILGLSAVIAPLVVARQVVRLDVPLLIVASVAVLVMGLDGAIGRLDGALLVTGVVAYTVFLVRQSLREHGESVVFRPRLSASGALRQVALVVGGLVLLVIGSQWLVEASVAIARALGVSDLVIGLTIIAFGTSLPEAATSVIAALRGERDIAVGNAIGSCLFNVLAILGTAGLISGGIAVAPAALRFDIPVMVAVAVACLPIFFTESRIARWEGALFLAYLAAYTLYVLLRAAEHDALPAFSAAMSLFVMPLTALTLLIVGYRAWTAR